MAACKFVVGVIAVFCFSLYGVDGQGFFSEFSHTCAVSCSDKISCWGDNRYGQLGSNNINLTENQIEMRDVKQISAGGGHTCALKNNGSVSCWGLNEYGQLGNSFNSETGTANPNPLNVNFSNVKQITAGAGHTCALKNDGSVSCWGLNKYGQLGNSLNSGTENATFTPLNVNISNVKQITAGTGHTCALKNNGSVSCWGLNGYGQLGNLFNSGTENPNPIPLDVDISNVKQISTGSLHTCALKNDRTVSCWGWNFGGQLANSQNIGTNNATFTPLDVNILNVKQITAGFVHTCALKNDRTVFCWGLKFSFGNAEIISLESIDPTSVTFTPEETAITQNNNVAGIVIEVTADLGWTCSLYDTKEIYCMGVYDVKDLDDPNHNFTVQPDRKNLYYKTMTDAAFLADSVGENACSTNDDDDTKLSIPVIVGIVAGAVLLFGGIVYYCLKRSAKGYEYVFNK
jgi:alpha-tubulin suppressor-like RCC1 family protein